MNKAIIFSHVTFLSSSEVSVVSNISLSQSNTNLQNRHFWYEQFLIFKY